MQSNELTLRERQRLEVSSAIHNATAELLLEHGWAATTIDMIATRVGVSNRTFFNHFPTKEDAALGLAPLRVSDEALREFRDSAADLFDRTVMLTMSVLRSAAPDDGLGQRRKTLIKDLPELQLHLRGFATTASELIEPILIEELSASRGGSADDQEVVDAARALRMLAGTTLRFAFGKDPAALSTDPTEALSSAITIFREAMRSQS